MKEEVTRMRVRCKRCMYLVYFFLALIMLQLLVGALNTIGTLSKDSEACSVTYESGAWHYKEAYLGERHVGESLVPYQNAQYSSKTFVVTFTFLDLLVNVLPWLFILLGTRKILMDTKKNYSPFVGKGSKWLRMIGVLCILQGLFSNFVIQAGMSTIVFGNLIIRNPLDLANVLVGMLVLVLVEIFQYGGLLQEEQDTTL